MRYGDMILKLYPKEPTDKPSAPDAVHVLMPSAIGSKNLFPWLGIVAQAKTPDHHNGENSYVIECDARPVPKELVPEWIRVGYQRPKKWPDGLPQVMPDFFGGVTMGSVVSSDARAVLETLAPGLIEYIELVIETPPGMVRAQTYYLINVLPQARLLDWDEAKSWNWTGTPGLQILGENSRNVVFKPMKSTDPLMWHEMSLDDLRRSAQWLVLMRGVIWNELIKHFPMQLQHQCLTDPRAPGVFP